MCPTRPSGAELAPAQGWALRCTLGPAVCTSLRWQQNDGVLGTPASEPFSSDGTTAVGRHADSVEMIGNDAGPPVGRWSFHRSTPTKVLRLPTRLHRLCYIDSAGGAIAGATRGGGVDQCGGLGRRTRDRDRGPHPVALVGDDGTTAAAASATGPGHGPGREAVGMVRHFLSCSPSS